MEDSRRAFFAQLQYTPRGPQARLHRALDAPGRNAVYARITFGGGLTTALIHEAIYQAACNNAQVLLLACNHIESFIRHMADAEVYSARGMVERSVLKSDRKIAFPENDCLSGQLPGGGFIHFTHYRSLAYPIGSSYDLILMDNAGFTPGPAWADIAALLAERDGSLVIGASLNRPYCEAFPVWPEMLAHVLRGDPNFTYSEVNDGCCKRIPK